MFVGCLLKKSQKPMKIATMSSFLVLAWKPFTTLFLVVLSTKKPKANKKLIAKYPLNVLEFVTISNFLCDLGNLGFASSNWLLAVLLHGALRIGIKPFICRLLV